MVCTQIISKETSGQRLDRWLKHHYPTLSYSVLQKWLRTGQIRLNGKRVKGSVLIKSSDQLRLPPQLELLKELPEKPRIKHSLKTLEFLRQNIIFEDNECCVINKPIGLAVQGGTHIEDHIDLYLKELCPQNVEPLRLTHRLDKDTSGVLLLAKSYQAARYFTQLFKKGQIQKRYLAIVVGKPKDKVGVITESIHKKTDLPLEKKSIQKKEAVTEYQVLAISNQGLSLLELLPKTGRTHQLRIHCALSLGCPILGDGKYGGKRAQPFAKRVSIHLHAYQVVVPYGTDRHYQFSAPIPNHLQKTLNMYFDKQISVIRYEDHSK